MRKESLAVKRSFGEVLPDDNFGIGSFDLGRSDQFRYIVTARDDAYLTLFSFRGGMLDNIYLASEEAYKEMHGRRMTLDNGPESPYFTVLGSDERNQGTVNKDNVDNVLNELGEDFPKQEIEGDTPEEQEESNQTEEEAKVFSGKEIVKNVMQMFEDGCGKLEADKLCHLEAIKSPTGMVIEKVAYTVYQCTPAGGLIPNTILWHPRYLIFKTPKQYATEKTQKLIYENIRKSSKRSYGLGLNLMPSAPDILGPVEGKKIHKKGKPKTGSGGIGINFSYNSCKDWQYLKIQAEVRTKEEFGGYDIITVPAIKS